ncbi:MAG: DUF429 domain-containing protein, partial [Candidatus Lokiarchaeota archaeon]|nr:DUF429 domain-containing protein [Candidatus Lokiarchaeota archaeon]
CSDGWFCTSINDENRVDFSIYTQIKDFFDEQQQIKLVFNDIPIGLPTPKMKSRKCDFETRKLLTRKRSSSVFPVPTRKAIYAESYLKANNLNRRLVDKGVSKQAWNLSPKIRDVDEFLREHTKYISILIESHPEICFWALAGKTPMQYYKKTKKGIEERISLLNRFIPNARQMIQDAQNELQEYKFELDDIFDSMILAASAKISTHKYINMFSENTDYDRFHLPMRIVYPKLRDTS